MAVPWRPAWARGDLAINELAAGNEDPNTLRVPFGRRTRSIWLHGGAGVRGRAARFKQSSAPNRRTDPKGQVLKFTAVRGAGVLNDVAEKNGIAWRLIEIP